MLTTATSSCSTVEKRCSGSAHGAGRGTMSTEMTAGRRSMGGAEQGRGRRGGQRRRRLCWPRRPRLRRPWSTAATPASAAAVERGSGAGSVGGREPHQGTDGGVGVGGEGPETPETRPAVSRPRRGGRGRARGRGLPRRDSSGGTEVDGVAEREAATACSVEASNGGDSTVATSARSRMARGRRTPSIRKTRGGMEREEG